jgi:hypothetical protein
MKTDKSQNISDFQRDFTEILETVLSSQNFACHFDDNTEDILDSRLWENILDRKRSFENLLRDIKDDFNNWRKENCEVSETFQFWDTFIHTDFMSYLGLYLGIRSRNWNLRNVSLKNLNCLFYAFDRHNYLRMIPYHIADLQTFPKPVLDHFQADCFAVSISGGNYYSVTVVESHEMVINATTKRAIHSFSPTALIALALYLPYRADTPQFKSTFVFGKESNTSQRTLRKSHES